MKTFKLTFLLFMSVIICNAQNKNIIKNITWKKSNEGKLIVEYFLEASVGQEYILNMKVTDEKSNVLTPFAISGDFPNVKDYGAKKFIWDVFKDRDVFPTIGNITMEVEKIIDIPISILIETIPSGSSIALNGKAVGISPLNIELPAGKYGITIYKSDDYEEFADNLVVDPIQKNYSFKLSELVKNLAITSKPTGSKITANGLVVGTTPMNLTYKKGQHIFRVSKTGYITRKKSLQVTDKPKERNFNLKPNSTMGFGYVYGDGTQGGELFISGKTFGAIIGFMGIEPLSSLPFSNYNGTGFSGQLSLRIPYPVEFIIHGGYGMRVFTNKDNVEEFIRYESPVFGASIPIYFSRKFGLYVKGDYWLESEDTELIMFSAGIFFGL